MELKDIKLIITKEKEAGEVGYTARFEAAAHHEDGHINEIEPVSSDLHFSTREEVLEDLTLYLDDTMSDLEISIDELEDELNDIKNTLDEEKERLDVCEQLRLAVDESNLTVTEVNNND